MPEVIIARVDVQKVQGRVTVAGRGEHDVTLFIDENARIAHAEIDTPDGQVIEATVGGPLTSLAPRELLEAAVRGALIEED